MSRFPNIKTSVRAVLAMALLATALVVPAQSFGAQNCADVNGDPTAAQYCSISGANDQGGTPEQDVKGARESGNNEASPAATEPAVTTESVPVAETAVESSSSGSLPFTGLDVGILALVAVALVGAGLVLRRLTAAGVHKA